MKLLLTICLVAYTFFSSAQKYDERLIQNHGDTISNIYQKSHNYYNFLLFEMDYSYVIKEKHELSKQEISTAVPAKKIKNASGKALTRADLVTGVFNFKAWGIVLDQHKPLIFKLDGNHYLYFYDKVSNNVRFGTSPLYRK
jgi:hypothetical protein